MHIFINTSKEKIMRRTKVIGSKIKCHHYANKSFHGYYTGTVLIISSVVQAGIILGRFITLLLFLSLLNLSR